MREAERHENLIRAGGRTKLMKSDVVPLITASEAYPRMEALAAGAARRIWLSFRVFDMSTRLRTEEARRVAGGDDWASLLAERAADGVDVRVQIADFDPLAAPALHEATWASLSHLNETPGAAGGRIEAIAARHPARFGAVLAFALAAKTRPERRALLRRYGARIHDALPRFRDHAKAFAPRVHPATHHQKLAVFDDAAVVGGLDVDERRWDTPEHDQASQETWRDATLQVGGGGAAAAAERFVEIWNRSVQNAVGAAACLKRLPNLAAPTSIAPPPATPADRTFELVATRSVPSSSPFGFGPRTTTDETFRAVAGAIAGARRSLYIETQFLRSRAVVDALCEAARRSPTLELIVILPFAPERFAFAGRRDAPMKHAEALQLDAIRRIRDAFGARATILSPAKPSRRSADDGFAAYGAGIVYVHSKVLIADDDAAIVGSANLNDRSMRWDTELSAVWRDRVGVAKFRERLAESWLGAGFDGDPRSVAAWRQAAEANAAAPPDLREGFLLPYADERAARFSRRARWLPDALF